MKIALIGGHMAEQPDPAAGGYPGDPAGRVVPLATALAELGHEVSICFRSGSPRLTKATTGQVSVELVQAGPGEPTSEDRLLSHIGTFARKLDAIWRQHPPDVIHAHDWIGGLAALAGARELAIPVVQTFTSLGAVRRTGQRERTRADQARLEAGIGRNAAAVLAGCSEDLAALVRRGLPRTAIKVVPPGVDTSAFRPGDQAARRSRAPRLLMIAPLSERQAIAAALHALARITDAELIVASGLGEPALTSAPGYAELARLASALGVRARLTFASRLDRADAPAMIRSADVVLCPTGSEPFAMVAIEAMACGVPVIATPTGVQRDAVIHGTTGYLVAPGDPESLTRRIRQLLSSAMLREAYGIAAATRVRARYPWQRIAAETLAVYEAVPPRLQPAAA
jgi:D-inositol-3-phosphate glycosyltransferase